MNQLCSPIFDEAALKLRGNKSLRIIAHRSDNDAMYIASATLNGKSDTKSYISYNDIVQGGEFHLYLQKKPASFIK